MQSKLFNPEKLSMIDFKFIKGQVDTPESFDNGSIEGHHIENTFQLGFNLEEKLIRAEYSIFLQTRSKKDQTKEAEGNFDFVFIFRLENMEELTKLGPDNFIELDSALGNALASISYSTSRGILLTRLQGTAFNNFILPIIDPNNLLNNKERMD